MSANPHAMLYIDTGALATVAYDILIPIAQLKERRPELDLLALPTSDVIAQNLGGTVFGFKTDNDGILAEGFSPTGALSFIAGIPAAIQRIQQRQAEQANQQVDQAAAPRAGGGFFRRGGNEELPAGVKEEREGNARDLFKALNSFAKDNDGKFPEKLGELQGKYFNKPNVNLDAAVYRGKQDAPNKVVAHSQEKNPGPITILTQDGTVATISRRALGRALNQGYTPEAPTATGTGAAPKPGEAVKPPRPPEF